jgi:plastocyanin
MFTRALRHAFAIPLGAAMLMTAPASGLFAAHAQAMSTVLIKDFAFSPAALTIKAGTTVTWKNTDDETHTVVGPAGIFRSSGLDQGDTYKFKFDRPGVYAYICSMHPHMKATIVVQ